MTTKKLCELLSAYKKQIEAWSETYRETDLEFVYNENLDRLVEKEVKYILVGDNPGKNEKEQNKYFIGEAGLVAKWFFKSELDIMSFENEVLILNKTPIYSEKTDLLNQFYPDYLDVMKESQGYMACLIYKIQKILKCEVIIIGYGGSKKGGEWDLQAQTNKSKKNLAFFYLEIKTLAENDKDFAKKIFNFPHFSSMQFPRHLLKETEDIEQLNKERIFEIGKSYTKKILDSVL